MKNIKYRLGALLLVLNIAFFSSCDIDPVVDLDNPSIAGVLKDASIPQLQSLVTGLESANRGYYGSATQMFGAFGREVWAYFGSDPRFFSDWLGIGTGKSDTYPDFFGSAGSYSTPYVAVKQANVLIQAAENSSAVTGEQINGYKGLANTIKGFQMLWPWLQQWDNGIRVNVTDPLNPGPIVGRAEALAEIRKILDEGYGNLQAAGSSFSFTLSSGFAGFNTPANLAKVNRAIAARAAIYAEDWSGALAALGQSFMDLSVDAASSSKMDAGPSLVFGEAPDVNNPLYYPFDRSTSTILICHPSWIEQATPGDKRLAKVVKRVANPLTNNGLKDAAGNLLVGEYQDARWATNTASIPFIRNEELILIYAEAQARSNNAAEALKAIDVVRTTWGLEAYKGGTSTDDLIGEILYQRRYSLWSEGGHRWVDLRRTGRLNSTNVDLRDRGSIFTQVARPTSETAWDAR